MASPVGEDNWVAYVDQRLREAADFETRVNILESFRRAVSAEFGSLKVWMAYCEYFWSLYTDCQPGSDAGWPPEEQQLGREMFTLDLALNLWQEGYEAVQYRLSDSHELWNRWIGLEMELLARTTTEPGIRRITQLFKNRLTTPHSTWDNTSQMFSSFLSEYNREAYEYEMEQATKNAKDAKRLYGLRDQFELKLITAAKSSDAEAQKAVMADYLDWEIRQTKNKKDPAVNFRLCLGLFSRALTGVFASDESTWLNFIVLVSSTHSDVKAGRSKVPTQVVPNMLDVLQRAVHHIPWSGPVWARYILAAEEAGLSFTDIERIKHAATSNPHLDRDGMTGVLEMYSAWCGYLKRKAMDPTASEESVDLAEVGLPAALEDVRHWGKRRYGNEYQGDPNFRLEKILIQFLTEKKDDIESARALWEQLSDIELHANSYDFWLHWFLWEMVVFAATKNKIRSPTPATLAQGLRVPSFATHVFQKALKVRTLDWPERIMEVYLQHCNDYELAETLREGMDTVYKTRKGVAKRREREAAQAAQAQAPYVARAQAQTHDEAMTDAPGQDGSPATKRKREATTEIEGENDSKRPRNEYSSASDLKRDRENTSVYITNLPSEVTQTKIRQFFREYGHINNIDLQKQEGVPAVALVEFRSPEEARSALLRDGKYFGDTVIQVTPATDCTLFVTNYPPEADEKYIRDVFKHCGEIHSIRFPSLKFNTKRRFCYVSFRTRDAANAAAKLDGKALEGGKYKLQAKFSDPGGKQQRQGAQAEGREIHVLNLPKSTTEDDLKGLFEKAGKVVSVRIPRNMAGQSHGTAFVVMETKEEAEEAVAKLDKLIFGNHPIKVEISKAPSSKTTATSRTLADGAARSPDAESPGGLSRGSPSPAPTAAAVDGAPKKPSDIAARTIAVMGIPDTMNDARVRSILEPVVGTAIVKLVLHPQHGGAIVEFGDVPTARKASLAINGVEIEEGKKLRTGTVPELFKQKAEKRVDRIDQPAPKTSKKQSAAAAASLMPPPAIRRPVLGRGGAKRGLGFVGGISKKEADGANGVDGAAPVQAPPASGKTNADFKKMFLQAKTEEGPKE
ncbi:hypothetical protein QBC46DRAFT_379030 [Diplogelasinospora grovesii]|uniref:U4/U6 snRNA-associated-splicing factor PRP24 n=1 Tax=Diplogelasinospora grovesii TaxID=303347 RepID=A0AAN6S747_9PEZI|nr:hypothetical protein QBC46DRAFT_379030 [Diplogelasinospora grovesii]